MPHTPVIKRTVSTNGSRTKKSSNSTKTCPRCAGDLHSRENCLAKDAKCKFCHKKGHYEKACKIRQKAQHELRSQNAIGTSDINDDDDYDDYEEEFDIFIIAVRSVKTKAHEVFADIKFHTKKPAIMQGKVDTGAMVMCIPLSKLKEVGLHQDDLKPSNAKLCGVTGTDIKTCSEINVRATCNGLTHKIKVLITELGTELILGLDVCKLFKLVTIADTCVQRKITVDECRSSSYHESYHEADVNYTKLRRKWAQHLPLGKNTGDPLEDLNNIYPAMFDGSVSLLNGEVGLQLSPETKPTQLPPCSVPLSIMPQLKDELDKMVKQGIIRPCLETTDWVHNLVIVSKENGDIRVCLNPKTSRNI